MNIEISSIKPKVLVLGATGYIGGRLVPRLLEAGYRVRAASRSLEKLKNRSWAKHPNVEFAAVDLLSLGSLEEALQGCDVAYYLVHSMEQSQQDFAKADRKAAHNMVTAAQQAQVKRIIYLSGLGGQTQTSSPHLRSRQEVADILNTGTVPVTVLRAAVIIGSGSASFEILRYLTDRLPVMITPKWVSTPCQPIAIRNVLQYLIGCLRESKTIGETFDIGGPDIVTYRKLMEIYAEEAGLGKRWIIPVPFFTPSLSSYWIHLVTPVSSSIARPLAEGLRTPVICQDNRIRVIIPQELLTCREAIHLALNNIMNQSIETSWTDAGYLPPIEAQYPGDPKWAGGTLYKDMQTIQIHQSLEDVWRHIVRIGGKTGWYYGNWMWKLRGVMDKLSGGVGFRGGRRNSSNLAPGDALDFWRVLTVEEPYRLRLLAEMKLPGQALLEFHLQPCVNGGIELQQTAWFAPRGLMGILYWYIISPFHGLIFNGMIRGISKAVDQNSGSV